MSKRTVSETSPEKTMSSLLKKDKKGSTNLVAQMSINDLKSIFDEKQQHLATKSDVEEVRLDILSLKQENEALKTHVNDLQSKVEYLEQQIINIQKTNHDKNLIFKVEAKSQVDQIQEVVETCNQLSDGVSNISPEEIIEIKTWNPKFKNFIVKFKNKDNLFAVLNNTHKLKNNKISIQRDYPPIIRKRRAQLLNIRRLIKRDRRNSKAVVKGEKLIVDGLEYSWDDSKGLKHGAQSGFDKLTAMLNLPQDFFQSCLPLTSAGGGRFGNDNDRTLTEGSVDRVDRIGACSHATQRE